MFTETQIEDIIELLLSLNDETKIYIGTDSVRKIKDGKSIAKYATILIVHKNGCNGCEVFSHVSFMPDYDQTASKPFTRMMNEAMKSVELYMQIAPIMDNYNIEIHCDISTDPKQGSNVAHSAARGYIMGMTGKEAIFKPNAFCASFGADHYANGRNRSVFEKDS